MGIIRLSGLSKPFWFAVQFASLIELKNGAHTRHCVPFGKLNNHAGLSVLPTFFQPFAPNGLKRNNHAGLSVLQQKNENPFRRAVNGGMGRYPQARSKE